MTDGIFPARKDRKARMQRLIKMLDKWNGSESLDELIAKFCLEEGLSIRTVKEDYLKLLRMAGQFKD